MKLKHCIILFLAFTLISCSGSKQIIENSTNTSTVKTIRDTVRDTVYLIKADTSHYIATLSVDSTGKVSVVNSTSSAGYHLSAPKVRIVNNKITVDCEDKARELFKQWVEHYESTHIEKVTKKTIIEQVPKKMTKWQHFLFWTGGITWLILIATLIGWILNKYLKINRI